MNHRALSFPKGDYPIPFSLKINPSKELEKIKLTSVFPHHRSPALYLAHSQNDPK